MDRAACRHTLSGMFDDFPRSVLPADPLLLSDVSGLPGLAEPNNLALLRAAAMALGPDEAYLGAGSHSGLSAVTVENSCSSNLWLLDDFSMVSRGPLDAALANMGSWSVRKSSSGTRWNRFPGLFCHPSAFSTMTPPTTCVIPFSRCVRCARFLREKRSWFSTTWIFRPSSWRPASLSARILPLN